MLDALQRLCRTLREQRRVCGRLSLAIRYSDQVEVAKRERIAPATCWEYDLAPVLTALFQRCFRRRVRLRRMTIGMTSLAAYAEQLSLFEGHGESQGEFFDDQPSHEPGRRAQAKALAVALDRLQGRFGERAIRYGRSQ